MATHKLKTPMRVGDIKTGIMIDALELVSVSINFQNPSTSTDVRDPATGNLTMKGQGVTVSCMLRHPSSGWIHTVTLNQHTRSCQINGCPCKHDGYHADAVWEAIKKTFPDFEKTILQQLTPHLPEGTQE